ncbi:MAG: hypothetical protein ACYTKD_28160 [Planctomycetota bacterium]
MGLGENIGDMPDGSGIEMAEELGEQEAPLTLGRGLDIGTCNLVRAVQTPDGNIGYRRVRNTFVDVDVNDYTKKMLTIAGCPIRVVQQQDVRGGQPRVRAGQRLQP